MKNNIFTKWLRKLPVLVFAFIFSFSLLLIAAPARADVLNGSSNRSFNAWGSEFPPPYVDMEDSDERFYLDEVGLPYVVVRHNFIPTCVYSDIPFTVELVDSTTLRFIFESGNDFGYLMFLGFSSSGWSFVGDIAVGELEYYDLSVSGITGYPKVYFWDLDLTSDSSFSEIDFSTTPSGLGILSVFSGVGSWLSGAVQNISTMFWTAESGMTVLGYLAVASLAVALILLIFYLIAGWLKFH